GWGIGIGGRNRKPLLTTTSVVIEDKDTDRRGEVAPVGAVIDSSYERRNGNAFVVRNLAQGIPELIFKRNARFVSIAYDRTLDDRGTDTAAIATGTIGCGYCGRNCLCHWMKPCLFTGVH